MYGLNYPNHYGAAYVQPANEVILEDENEYQMESTTHTLQQISQPRSLNAQNNRRNRSMDVEGNRFENSSQGGNRQEEEEDSGENHRPMDPNGRILDGMDLFDRGSEPGRGKPEFQNAHGELQEENFDIDEENGERNIIYDNLESMEEYSDAHQKSVRPEEEEQRTHILNEEDDEEEPDADTSFHRIQMQEHKHYIGIEESQSVEKVAFSLFFLIFFLI
jgi:hypothetical protein